MYTSSILVGGYSRGKVHRLPGDDSSRKDRTSRYAYTPDTTGDIYASNNDSPPSTFLFPDWRLVKDSSTWEALAGRSSTLT